MEGYLAAHAPLRRFDAAQPSAASSTLAIHQTSTLGTMTDKRYIGRDRGVDVDPAER
ncbi:hypothetical protein CORC01_01070 [Colletotrichum orchidophilum]|uniref:Uncharacterized protein n=1 Tax=Colletotrichum orchidophilum TaxID=1209926 RepID=A0A1G4BQM9_9PEZI|nr:uncharacterized protein CORC01_01070 [Colletotrichum orchidophilum]OHF03751.1 hypothetical protein CORC01_01070 [Colletotrichum orchidophilum]